jgi:hypothetical protein
MAELMRPNQLNEISIAADDAKVREARLYKEKMAHQKKVLQEAFMSRDVHPEVAERINEAVKRAAEQGHSQIQVLTFSSAYCNDRGRRINNMDPDWPESLEGFAKKAFEYWQKELKPLGYKLHAEILNFPDGVPGDVGMFLKW